MVVTWNAANGRLDGIAPQRRVEVFVEDGLTCTSGAGSFVWACTLGFHPAPQAEGYYEQGPANLGNPTLSVIDLAPSLQPMAAADGRYTLVYDGALYNFTCWRSRILRNWHRRCRLKTPR